MCIFSQPIISVGRTQIFARTTTRKTQFLVYQMNYESTTDNAMILPIPVRQPVSETSLRFIDLSEYETFFEDLDNGFPYIPQRNSIGCSAQVDSELKSGLIVFEVGSYIASFVPSISDFSRLDSRFALPKATWKQLPQYENFGFAVFQLASGSLKPHPMAFEFEKSGNNIVFPTLHIHDGDVHETEEFDHLLYLQHAGMDSRVYGYENSDVEDKSTGLVRSLQVAKQFCDPEASRGIIDGNLLVHRRRIHGDHPNRDTEIQTFGDPTIVTFNFRCLLPYAPWIVFASLFAWIFVRRNRIRRLKNAGNHPYGEANRE